MDDCSSVVQAEYIAIKALENGVINYRTYSRGMQISSPKNWTRVK